MTPHILLVDDEAAIRELYTLYFNSQGFQISTASNAVQALDAVYGTKFDVILLDLGLGDSNGMDLLEPIKIAQPDVPVVIFTGVTVDNQLRRSILARGAAAILRKSYPLNYVIEEVKRAINSRR